ncbi:MAG: galactokinase [Saprospiraceae bacterium]|nr:galactokinase [Saprospiraceae bacterium]HNL38873.1 galactokinase [Saprospiraceae bacterium]
MDKSLIAQYFRQQFSSEPQLLVRAPGRINLIGEHTDYNGGFVLPAAIDKAIWLAASRRSDNRLVFYAADLGETFVADEGDTVLQQEKKWANYLLGVISEARRDGMSIGGLNLAFGGDVPLGAGLSSSAALESGMMFALDRLFALGLAPMEIVRLAQRGENHFVGMKCGIMDMFASVMGRADQVVRLDCRSLDYAYFPFHAGAYSLLLLDSGVKHQLVDSEYNTRREECEKGVALLRRFDARIESLRDVSGEYLMQHRQDLPETVYRRCHFVVEEIARVEAACAALQADDFEELGGLMFAGHEGLDRDYEVCVEETNFLVDFARQRIAGARQMGGGFGGCTINLLKTSMMDAFLSDVFEAYRQRFKIELKCYPVKLTGGVAVV